MQGIVGAAFEGAGVAIGSLAGGAVYKAKVVNLVAIFLCSWVFETHEHLVFGMSGYLHNPQKKI